MFFQIGIFGLKTNHLATLVTSHENVLCEIKRWTLWPRMLEMVTIT
jgi:hypothetical protein